MFSRCAAKPVVAQRRKTKPIKTNDTPAKRAVKLADVHRTYSMMHRPLPCDITMPPASCAQTPDHCSSILAFAAHDEKFARIAIAAIAATHRSISPTGEESGGKCQVADVSRD